MGGVLKILEGGLPLLLMCFFLKSASCRMWMRAMKTLLLPAQTCTAFPNLSLRE
jgi:hypothetical protein